MRKAPEIELDVAQQKELMNLAHSNTTEVRLARRAGIVLLAAGGFDNETIGEMLDVGRVQAGCKRGAGAHAMPQVNWRQ